MNMNSLSGKKVLIALPPAMLKQVDEIAKAEHRTRSDLIREALRRYIFTPGYNHAPIPLTVPTLPVDHKITCSTGTDSRPYSAAQVNKDARRSMERASKDVGLPISNISGVADAVQVKKQGHMNSWDHFSSSI